MKAYDCVFGRDFQASVCIATYEMSVPSLHIESTNSEMKATSTRQSEKAKRGIHFGAVSNTGVVAVVEQLLKCQVLPPMPSSRSELDLSGQWCSTMNGENIVLANDGLDNKIVIFGTEGSLQHLAEATTFFVDGAIPVSPYVPLVAGFHHPSHEV